MTVKGLLNLPPEIRLIIFKFFLNIALHSQHNRHLGLLQTCTQIVTEAGPIVRQYLCLKDESQIRGLLSDAHSDHLAQVCTADVAVDPRLVRDNETSELVPVSALHVALRKMASLRSLRVFEARRPISVDHHALASNHRCINDLERALFPSDDTDQPPLSTYELLLPEKMTVTLLTALRSPFIETLRLSGTVRIAEVPSTTLKNLKHLTISDVQGSYFDTRDFSQDFPSIPILESFIFSQIDWLSFKLQDRHLHAISAANSLRKLILIDCRELTTATIAHCLKQFQRLEHFALAFVTALELEVNFIRDTLPVTIQVLRLSIQNGRTKAFVDEEGDIYRSVGNLMEEGSGALSEVSLNIRPELLSDPMWETWLSNVAHRSHIRFSLGPWISSEYLNEFQ